MRCERVTDVNDERVSLFRDVRDADLRGRDGLFMAESEMVIRTLVKRGRFGVRSLLLNETRAEAMEDVVSALPETTPVFVAAQPVMDVITGFHIHRGALALCDRGEAMGAEAVLRSAHDDGRHVVVLDEISNHDNVGSVFRNARAFGFGGALLTPTSCDPLYRKAIRVSMGACVTTPFATVHALPSGMETISAHGFVTIALTPHGDTIDLNALGGALAPGARCALILGAEGPGLSPAAEARADVRVRIPIAEGMDSINVATASGIAMYVMQSLPS